MTPATIQEKGSGLLQVFLGLLAGGTITMALFALAFFLCPTHQGEPGDPFTAFRSCPSHPHADCDCHSDTRSHLSPDSITHCN